MGIHALMVLRPFDATVGRYASVSVFPLLVMSFGLAQVRPAPPSVTAAQLASAIGQVASVLSVIMAMLVILTSMPGRRWPAVLVGLLIVVRAIRLGVGDVPSVKTAYDVLLGTTCSAAGALVLLKHPGLLRRQFAVFCAISLPLMILQMTGVYWTQLLRTDMGPTYMGYEQVRTLFVPAGQIVITTFQSRPAGFMYANNVASLVAVFGIALHYARVERSGRLEWTDFAVLAFLVLLMSRLAFVVLGLIWIMRLSIGVESRRHILRSAGVLAVFLGVYWLFFPGLFANNVSWYNFAVDLEIRIVELMVASGIPWLVRLAERIPHEWAGRTVDPIWFLGTGVQSGYGRLLHRGWLFPPVAAIVLALVLLMWRWARRLEGHVRREFLAVGMTALLAPTITSFLGAPIFWFLSAGAFVPFWRFVEPAFGTRTR